MAEKKMRYLTPEVWGEPMWRSIHSVAIGYPQNPSDEVKKAYKDWFLLLAKVLPCIECSKGYASIIKDNPIDEALGTRADLIQWTVNVHNAVSKKLGKPEMSVEHVTRNYVFGEPAINDPEIQKDITGYTGYILLSASIAIILIYIIVKRIHH